METKAKIEKILREAFSPKELAVIDNSHRHAGHAGAKEGGHFEVRIVAECFKGKKAMECHRLIHDLLFKGDLQGKIHALSIKASGGRDGVTPPLCP